MDRLALSTAALVVLCCLIGACDRDDPVFPQPDQAQVDQGVGLVDTESPQNEDRTNARDPRASERIELDRTLFGRREVLVVEHLISRSEIRRSVRFTGELEPSGPVAGQLEDENYNSIRFSSGDNFGVSIQVWRFGSLTELRREFGEMQSAYINVEESTIGEADAYRADFDGIRQVAFRDDDLKMIAVISCDDVICDSDSDVLALAELVAENLDTL